MQNKYMTWRNMPVIIVMWFLIWIVTQGIFINEIPMHLPWDLNTSYAVSTFWILTVMITSLILLPSFRKVSLPQSKLLWMYVVPLILLILLPLHYKFGLNIWVYIPMIIITVFWQDYLTFGILQPALAKRMSLNSAAILTAIVFILGHVIFFLHDLFNPQILLIAGAGFLFAFSRRYSGNIYIANIIHLTSYLL